MATTKTTKSSKQPAARKAASAKAPKTAAPTRPVRKTLNCPPVDRKWHLIDCSGETVGRLAVRVATLLRGKHRPQYNPQNDNGDFVVAINASKLKFTGNKLDQKNYYRHSGHMGGLKTFSARDVLATKPENILLFAVKGMLPQNNLSRKMLTKLKVFAGAEHPHGTQFATTTATAAA